MRLPPRLWHFLRSRGFRRFLIASPLLAVLAIAAFYTGVNLWGAAKLDRARQPLRDQGDPLTLKELISRNPPPEQDLQRSTPFFHNLQLDTDATLTGLGYTEAALTAWQGDPATGKLSSATRLLDGAIPDEPAAARKVLADLAPLAPNADQWLAAVKQRTGLGHSMSSEAVGLYLGEPEVGKAAVLHFFAHRARLHASSGDGDRALEDFRFLTDWCRLHQTTPRTLMSVVIRMGMAAIIANTAWDIAAHPFMTEPQLAALQPDLADMEILAPAIAAWRIERLLIMEQVERFQGGITAVRWDQINHDFDWSAPADWWPNASSWCRQLRPAGFAKADLAEFMEIINRDFLHLLDGSQRPFWTRADADRMQAIQNAKPAIRHEGRNLFEEATHGIHGLAATTINRNLRINATVRLAVLTVAAQRHHRAHGRFPTTIAELVPAFLAAPPIDPMSDQPIRIDPQPDGSLHLTAPGDTARKPVTWIVPPSQRHP